MTRHCVTELRADIPRVRRETRQHYHRHYQRTRRQRQPGEPLAVTSSHETEGDHRRVTSPCDVNDNPPKFDNAIYNVTNVVEEETGISKNNPKYLLTVCLALADTLALRRLKCKLYTAGGKIKQLAKDISLPSCEFARSNMSICYQT